MLQILFLVLLYNLFPPRERVLTHTSETLPNGEVEHEVEVGYFWVAAFAYIIYNFFI